MIQILKISDHSFSGSGPGIRLPKYYINLAVHWHAQLKRSGPFAELNTNFWKTGQ